MLEIEDQYSICLKVYVSIVWECNIFVFQGNDYVTTKHRE